MYGLLLSPERSVNKVSGISIIATGEGCRGGDMGCREGGGDGVDVSADQCGRDCLAEIIRRRDLINNGFTESLNQALLNNV